MFLVEGAPACSGGQSTPFLSADP